MTKTVLVTGSSSGIGRATVELFARRGWNVAATARNVAALPPPIHPDRWASLPLDVTDESSIENAVGAAIDRFGGIDVLVNNAGYGLLGPLEGATAGQLDTQFRTNVLGMTAAIRHVLPSMRQRGGGVIINLSSIGGRVGTPFCSAYYSTKFAIEGLSESLRFELMAHGIRVKLIEPAHFKTDFLSRSLQWVQHPAYEPQQSVVRAGIARMNSRARFGPEPVAEMILRAATDGTSRLRYPVNGRLILAIHAVMPDALWRRLCGAGMNPKYAAKPLATVEL